MTTTTNIFEDKYYGKKEIDPEKTGTHMMKQRPWGGWPNSCAPEVKPGRSIRRARADLAQRNKSFDDRKGKNRESGHVHQRPGSLKCR